MEEFDGVFSIFLRLPQEVRAKVQASMLRALKPGGLLILQNFSPAQPKHSSGGPRQAELLYTAVMLRQGYAPAVALELEEKKIQINEGHTHSAPPLWCRPYSGNNSSKSRLCCY